MKEIIGILEKNDLKLLDEWVQRQDESWADSVPVMSPSKSSFKDLLSDQSTISDKLYIGESPHGTGIFTRQSIKTGERLVSIDIHDLVLDNDSGISHPFFKKFPQLELIYTVISTTKHAAYLQSLPRSKLLPMYYSYQELDLLKHSFNHSEIVNDYILQFKQYSLLFKILSDSGIKPNFGFRKFQWARQIVLSRHNQIQILNTKGKLESHYCLAPVFDLFNHKQGDITGYFDVKSSKMVLDSGSEVEGGNEVFMSYGDRVNYQLFIYMGFCVDGNQGYVPLSLTLPKEGLEKRLQLVNGYKSQHTFKVIYPITDNKDLKRYIDVMLIPLADLENLGSDDIPSRSEKYLNTWVKVQVMKLRKSLEAVDKGEIENDRKDRMKAFLQSELDFMKRLS